MVVTEPKDLNLANVKVNRRYFRLEDVQHLTALMIRHLVRKGEECDVWERVPGHPDQKFDIYSTLPHSPDKLRQFFTAPRIINNLCERLRRSHANT